MAPSSPKRRKLENGLAMETPNGASVVDTSPKGERTQVKANGASIKRRTTSAGSLYAGDLLQMQVSELLTELAKTRKRRIAAANDHLRKLKVSIENLPERLPVTPYEGERSLTSQHKVAIPFPKSRPDKNAKYTVSYVKPTRVNVVGSFALDSAYVEKRAIPSIDLAVTMPSSIFQDKDYLNYRYFVKRAFYVACLAAGLSEDDQLGLSIKYEYQGGNLLQPILVAIPKEADLKSKYQIRILVGCTDPFDARKTLPTKNCLRGAVDGSTTAATPFYNASLRSECTMEAYLKFLHLTRTTNAAFQQACVLMNVWLRQRGLGSSIDEGGFGPFESSILMALLLDSSGHSGRSTLSSGYNHFQLFKGVLNFLASRNLVEKPFLSKNELNLAEDVGDESPIIWDGARGINICYKMSKASYANLRGWAKASLEAFKLSAESQIQTLLLRRCDAAEERFDDIINLRAVSTTSSTAWEAQGLSETNSFSRHVCAVLQEGLGVRTTTIGVRILSEMPSWSLRTSHPPKQMRQIQVGLNLDPSHIQRTVDRGPAAENKSAAARFRSFWGEKAELRRFQDSSILESVVWEEGEHAAVVHRQIIDYVCKRHFSQPAQYKGLELFARDASQGYASRSLNYMNALWRSYDDLQSLVRNLEKMPLQIRNFMPTSFKLENMDSSENRVDIMEIGLQFEGSARWPEDLVAIQRTKIAFLAQLQKLVQISNSDYKCQLQLENTSRPLLNCAFLEIAAPDSRHLFRVRIFHEREASLLDERLRVAASSLERTAYSDGLSIFNKHYVRQPEYVQAIRRLALRNPLLLPSIMLFRKWCSTHLLESHLSPELQDLIVAAVFTQPEPFQPPVNAGTGLIRVLKYLAQWDWWNEPLIVDFGDMTAALRQDAVTRFEAWRKIDPGLNRTVIFAASDLDIDGTTWTQKAPNRGAASRLSALATAAVARIDIDDLQISMRDIFSTGTNDYDFVIYLAPDMRRRGNAKSDSVVFKNLQVGGLGSSEVRRTHTDKASAMFVEEIAERFSDTAVLFHDWAAQDVPIVAGVWNPLESRSWKTNLSYSTMPESAPKVQAEGSAEAGQVCMNKTAILSDIARIGGDIIMKIETRQ